MACKRHEHPRPEDAWVAVQSHGSFGRAAVALGTSRRTLKRRYEEYVAIREDWKGFEADLIPTDARSPEEIVECKMRKYALRKAKEDAVNPLHIRIKVDGPIGIAHFGDPHIDDDGCNIALLKEHIDIVKNTEGMFAANLGDMTNNWVGRLARLYANQTTTAQEGWAMAKWLVNELPWLYIIGGNHDLWSGASDPVQWMASLSNTVYSPSQIRVALHFPNGREVRINARHDFKGHSQWNTAHGPGKAAKMGGDDHIFVCGHKHTTGYNINKPPTSSRVMHAIQVGSYKMVDDYARDGGFPNDNITPCAVTIIDPYADDETELVQLYLSPAKAARHLAWERAWWKKGRKGVA